MFLKSNQTEFSELAQSYDYIPVYEFIPADMLTPVLAYLRLRNSGEFTFLLESVEDSLNFGRYSFIGLNPAQTLMNFAGTTVTYDKEMRETSRSQEDIFTVLKGHLGKRNQYHPEGLPYFRAGAVGFFGYGNVELIEPTLKFTRNNDQTPESVIGLFHDIIVFDHLKHQIGIIVNVHIENDRSPDDLYTSAESRILSIKKQLSASEIKPEPFHITEYIKDVIDEPKFENAFAKIKNHILNGDVFQLVYSEKFSAAFSGDPLHVYRALRMINPSPYMYILDLPGGYKVIGTSPEDLVKVTGSKVSILPIAGTRRRGKNNSEDTRLAENLLADAKENAEHTMLVDLARNDLGRVCNYGSIKLTEDRIIKKYSHVMHIVSRVDGQLNEGISPVDVLKAAFPAGTVTGAPKIRAMEIIDQLENQPRGLYAGAVGYFDFSGNMDLCIAIRSFFIKSNIIEWQAGAGIVLDSDPELEKKEIRNKAKVLVEALQLAERIDENISH